jgi:hypothetical protein
MNIDQYKETISKHTSIILQVFCAGFALGLIISFLISPSKKPKSEICKNEIAQVKLLTMQLNSLREECSKQKTQILFKCKQEAREDTLLKIESYKKICENLRCEICKAANK